MRKYITLAFVILLFIAGCDTNSPQMDESSELPQSVQKLKKTHSTTLNHVGDHLRNQNATLSDKDVVRKGLLTFFEERFGSESSTYERAYNAFDNHKTSGSTDRKSDALQELPENVRTVVLDAQTAIHESSNYESFKKHLQQSRKEILNADWTKQEKETALSYLVLVEESMDFLKENQDLVPASVKAKMTSKDDGEDEEEEEEGWWESWGKCAAGTVGGAGGGALAGGAAGSAIPEPITSGIGAAAGAVFGALSGTAASC